MEFKVGDKYILKPMANLGDYEKCDTGAGWISGMGEFIGQVHVVARQRVTGNPYLRNPGGYEYFYSPNWLKRVPKFKGNK